MTTSSSAPARSAVPAKRRTSRGARKVILGVGLVALVAAMALNTKVVRHGSEEDTRPRAFSAAEFGAREFPQVKASVEQRAVDASELSQAIAEDSKAAAAKYGVPAGVGVVMPVRFTGVVTAGRSGIYTVDVPDVPEELVLRVQTGPAINGTDLRDATGTITFGQFTNQIEYQNAGAAINDQLKAEVLGAIADQDLVGRTISVVGAFTLINPKAWLVTPVAVSVQ